MENAINENMGLERRQLLAKLIQQQLKNNSKTGSFVFDLADLRKHQLLNDYDALVRTFDRLQEDLKPDFEYRLNQFVARPAKEGQVGTNQGIKISIDNKTKLDEYLLNPLLTKIIYFDLVKSRFFIKGTEIKIRKFSDQYHALRIMFENPEETTKEWFFSEVAERVDMQKPNDKTYYNAIYQIGIKAKTAGFSDFFITTRQSAKINPKYLS